MILCSPTGSGKTFMFSYMVKLANDRGKRALIVSDRIELMKQSGGSLHALGVIPNEIKAGHFPDLNGQVYVAMVETLSRRMRDTRYQRLMQSFDMIVFDEAHKQAFNKLFKYISDDTVVIGATATPHREGRQKALASFYDELIEVISIRELIDQGFLAEPKSYGVPVDLSQVGMNRGEYDMKSLGNEYSRNKVFEGVIENYKRLTPGKKALAFSPNIASSQELTEKLVGAGINARHLDSNMRPYDRVKTIAWYRKTPDAVLSNVGILTTGFDAPETEAIILYRATTSLPLFLQMVGRGSRIAPGKDGFTILDFGSNIQRFGFWEEHRKWSLEKKRKKKEGAAPVKNCPECEAILPAAARQCQFCGHEFEFSREQEKEAVYADLKLLTPRERRQMARGKSIEEKAEMAKAGLIKPYWVLHQLRDRGEAEKFVKLMGWKRGWWWHNEKRFPNLRRAAQKQY